MYPTASRLAHLSPLERAAFAVSSRLISCLVTESLLRAIYIPISDYTAAGFALILLHEPTTEVAPFQVDKIYAVVPLQHVPILSKRSGNSIFVDISLLDPLDMVPLVLTIHENQSHPQSSDNSSDRFHHFTLAISKILEAEGWFAQTKLQFESCWNPVALWNAYANFAHLPSFLIDDIASEISNSLKWQTFSFQNPPKAPQFASCSIEWEQSIVEGHPTHPMHKTRHFLSPLTDYSPEDFSPYKAALRFAIVPKSQLKITNDFEFYMKPFISAATRLAGDWPAIPDSHIFMPVHELQVVHIRDKFPDIEILPEKYSVPLLAQQSIRSVQVSYIDVDLSLKLAVGVKLTSAVRTISPASAYLGPRFSSQVVPYLRLDPKIITVAKELASVVHIHPDGEIAKHCAAIVREAHENNSEQRGERLIVCTALVESGHAGDEGHIPAVIRVFNLNTQEKRIDWLNKFVRILLEAFLPSVLHNGVAFECHPQNCLARFDVKTKEIRGFIIRDFGGIRVHPETLHVSTGITLDCVPGHSIVAASLDDLYKRLYHALIHNHLQQLIRVLGLHNNGRGWDIVRKHLVDILPRDHGLYKAWLSPESKMVESKCFLRMRMAGMYRFHLHSPVPNLIHYLGSTETNE